MTTVKEITPAQVKEAILTYLDKDDYHRTEASWPFIRAIAEALNVDLSEGTLRQRAIIEDQFAGKVRRGLSKLADEKVLVKDASVRPTMYLTPGAHTKREQQRKRDETAQRLVNERALALRNRLKALGVSGTNYTDSSGRITMDLDMVEALVQLAERGK